MAIDGLRPLTDSGADWSARKVVRALGLRDGATAARPRVVAAMIASADGRAAVAGRSVALGHPADRSLLRELRASVDAVLVGTHTIAAERYANLLDPEQREQRVAAGLEGTPIVATIARRLDRLPVETPLFSEPDARVQVYTEDDGDVAARLAWLAVHRVERGELSLPAVLEHLAAERAVRVVSCEGGPTLLRELIAQECLDDLLLTISPLLLAGDAPGVLAGELLDPPPRMALRDVHRADDHLFLHYAL